MAIDIDDELLARSSKFDGFLPCPIGRSEDDLRELRNQLVGDPYRKKQFLLGPGFKELLNIAQISCSHGEQHTLVHILTIIASIASLEEAMPFLLDVQVMQLINFVISSSCSTNNLVLPALKILRNIVNFNHDIELPLPELVWRTQSGCDRVAEICFSIFARYSSRKIGIYSEALLSVCFSRIRQHTAVSSCLEFFHSVLQSKQQWEYRNFPMDSFLSLVEHDDPVVYSKAILCVSEMHSNLRDCIPEFSQLLRRSFQILILSVSQKERSRCFHDQCRALTSLLQNHPSFIPDAQPVLTTLVSVTSSATLEALGTLASHSEACRRQICSLLDFQLVKSCLRNGKDFRLAAANLIRILSRSFCSTRMKLFKIGMVQVLFDELGAAYRSDSDRMTDIDSPNDSCSGNLSDDDLQFATTLTASIANLLIDSMSLPRPDVSRLQVLLLIRGAKSNSTSLRENSCLALRNWCYNATPEMVADLIRMISISEMQSILQDPSERVQINAMALIGNVLVPETNKLWNDYSVTAQLISQFGQFLEGRNPNIILETVSALANIAAGFRIRKILLLCNDHVLRNVCRLLDHSWPEILLMSIIFFDNLFCRAYMFKKQRMVTNVPIDRLLAMNLTESLIQVQAREKARGNYDAEARAERAVKGCKKSLRVLQEVLQTR